MRTATLLLLLIAPSAGASELYADVGIGYLWGATWEHTPPRCAPVSWDDPRDPCRVKEAPGPHAAVEIGYTAGQASLFVLHASSVKSGSDRGVNFVGVKYRFSVKAP